MPTRLADRLDEELPGSPTTRSSHSACESAFTSLGAMDAVEDHVSRARPTARPVRCAARGYPEASRLAGRDPAGLLRRLCGPVWGSGATRAVSRPRSRAAESTAGPGHTGGAAMSQGLSEGAKELLREPVLAHIASIDSNGRPNLSAGVGRRRGRRHRVQHRRRAREGKNLHANAERRSIGRRPERPAIGSSPCEALSPR